MHRRIGSWLSAPSASAADGGRDDAILQRCDPPANPFQGRIMRRGKNGSDSTPDWRIAALRRLPKPCGRGGGQPALGEQRGVVELAAEIARMRRLPIPVQSRARTWRASPALFQAAAEQVHRSRMAAARGAQIPAQRLTQIARDAAPIEQQVAEIVLAPVVAAPG